MAGLLVGPGHVWVAEPETLAGQGVVLRITAFRGPAGDGRNTTPAVGAGLEEVRRTKAAKFVFPPGRYDFWPDRATERYLFVCNNE